ncbi:peptide ABC transporter permease [Candidatus Epulonipiscium fishelsonii]|uniref:Peptide ABC transporter permease n=1 Tax=Candidatus Epulonipiscium fishelsonii TaxID=77094 RepID=A0ACC8X7Q8_9FIRM|nr:peptide ABC transporter permease [Epulopiscium sp. SCG-B11WGA-EpuloA1]
MEFYQKKVNKRKLSGSLEYITSKLSWQVSLVITIIALLSSIDIFSPNTSEVNKIPLIISIIFLFEFIIQFAIYKKITAQIISNEGQIGDDTRKMGWILLPFVITGNFFMFIAGFMLIKKHKTLEYQLCVYSSLTTISILLLSSLNLFKDSLVSTFMLGISAYGIYAVINLITLYFAGIYTVEKRPDKKFLPLALIGIIGLITGNVFSFLMGTISIAKYFNKNEEVTIEWVDVIRRLFKNYMAAIGMLIVVFLISVSIASLLTFDYDIATLNNYSTLLQSPSLMYPFGTDELGRCVFTRIVFGARISLLVGLVATIVPIIIGGFLGAISGYYGGKTDNILMRLLDVLYAVPGILLAIAIIAAFGVSTMNLILALSIGGIPSYARTVRATVMSLAGQEFVEAAKACGATNGTIIFKHIIPNSLAPVIVRATMGIGSAVLSTSSLSFLGLGVASHVPEWGNILKAGSTYLETNPYIAIFPGLAIITIVLAFNYFGDGLRDALDPKLK